MTDFNLFGEKIPLTDRPVKKSAVEIIRYAVEEFKPAKVVLMFSGGYDSLVSSHISASILRELSIPFVVYHGDTTIGIPETQEFVKNVCSLFGWELFIRQPPNKEDHYDAIVEQWGFPGATKQSHRIMYRRLKERAINRFVTHECKSTPYARENVLLLSGIRQDESKIRQGYSLEVKKVKSKVWANPIFWMKSHEVLEYRRQHDLPVNMVKENMCISGECLCGSFADNTELNDLKLFYPDVAKRIEMLHQMASENGFPWPWSSGPNDWWKNHPPGQSDMFMCAGCEAKRKE